MKRENLRRVTKKKKCHITCRQLKLSQEEQTGPIALIFGGSILNGMKTAKRLGIGLPLTITGENPRRIISEEDLQREGPPINMTGDRLSIDLLKNITKDLQKDLQIDTEEGRLMNMTEDLRRMTKTEIHLIIMVKGLQKEGIQKEDLQIEGPRKEDLRKDGPRKEDLQKEDPQKEDLRKEDLQIEGPQKEDLQIEGPRKEDLQIEGPRKEDLQREDHLKGGLQT